MVSGKSSSSVVIGDELQVCRLWYEAGIVVAAYEDVAVGIMVEDQDGGGQFELIGVPKISRDSKKDCGEPGCPSDHRSQVFP